MNISQNSPTDARCNAEEARIWAERLGAPTHDVADRQYGRRVEIDRSWTVYHVFTGIPALVDGAVMAGFTGAEATMHMLALNLRGAGRPKQRSTALPFAHAHAGTSACRP